MDHNDDSKMRRTGYPRTLLEGVQDLTVLRFHADHRGFDDDFDERTDAGIAALLPVPRGEQHYASCMDWWHRLPSGVRSAGDEYQQVQLALVDGREIDERHRRVVIGLAVGLHSGVDVVDVAMARAFFACATWLV